MTASPKPLTPEELAEGRRLFDAIEYSKLTYEDKYPLAEGFYAWLVEHADRLLSAAERVAEADAIFRLRDQWRADCALLEQRLAECERQSHIDRELALVRQRALSEAVARYETAERQLAEAQAVIVFDRHPDSDFTWKRPPFYAAAVEAAHAASGPLPSDGQ